METDVPDLEAWLRATAEVLEAHAVPGDVPGSLEGFVLGHGRVFGSATLTAAEGKIVDAAITKCRSTRPTFDHRQCFANTHRTRRERRVDEARLPEIKRQEPFQTDYHQEATMSQDESDLGTWGERVFVRWAAFCRAAVGAPSPDKLGWDRLVQFPQTASTEPRAWGA